MKNVADIKLELIRRIEDAKFEASLWKDVKILKKKDGTDFATRSKSFENAKWMIPSFSDEFHPELKVMGQDSKGHWHEYVLYMYLYCDDMKPSDARKELGQKSASYMRATYVLTPSEAYVAIKDRIASLEASVSVLEAELREVNEIYLKFFYKISEAFNDLKEDCKQYRSDEKYPSSLEYLMCDVLKENADSMLRR